MKTLQIIKSETLELQFSGFENLDNKKYCL